MTRLTILLAETSWDNHMGDWSAGWWIVMVLLMIVFWGLLILGAVWLIRSLAGGAHTIHHRDPVEVLDHRLARGEISGDEYRERRKLLREKSDSKQA
ncbi:MAG TPA: hypothetical protein VFM51_00935 [Solirubrobacterales bacterium]|nr:hypothetical protein [Solirubrobacterales bacterium]